MQDIIPLPQGDNKIIPEAIHYELQLEDISLDNIHQLISKAESIEEEDHFIDHWPVIMAMPSWSTIMLYVIGAGLFFWKLYNIQRKKSKTTPDDGPAGSCRSIFHLKEGGVTIPDRLVITDHAPQSATRGVP